MGENVVKIRELVQSDCRLTCMMIADELDNSKETVEARAMKLDGGTKGQTFHFVHGLCGTTSRR
jgi:hypothetical protein